MRSTTSRSACACDGGQLNVVRYLNEHGIKLNARNNEPICRACDAGHMEVVRYLHQNGGELTARATHLFAAPRRPVTWSCFATSIRMEGTFRRASSRTVAP